MKNLKMIWMFNYLVWLAAWMDEGTEEKKLAEVTRNAMEGLMLVRLTNSKFWVFWLLVLWASIPIATVWFVADLCIKDLKI